MKKFALLLSIFTISAFANPDTTATQSLPSSLQGKKTYLEEELKELEAREKDQMEIQTLEAKIQFLKEKQANQIKTPAQNSAQNPNTQALNLAPATLAEDEDEDDEDEVISDQEYRDLQTKRAFGKNRNGVLLRFMAGSMRPHTMFNKDSQTGFGFGVGYQRFFSFLGFGKPSKSPLGFRIYADSFAPFNNGRTQTMSSANIDGLLEFNFPNSFSYFGVFGGVGYARFDIWDSTSAMMSFRSSYHRETIAYNFGTALTLGAKHRFEFYYKVLPEQNSKKLDFAWKERNLISFVYQFTF
ncbi:hypothetical protein [Helicobacter sp. T3_23-1059]